MASGGARARSGPAPDPNAYRRDRDRGEWITLPKTFDGVVPDFPLPEPHERELEIWSRLWTQGQAIMWLADEQAIYVAMYARLFAYVEMFTEQTTASLLGELRRQGEDLGLTQSGLARNKWRLGDKAELIENQKPAKKAARQTSSGDWLKSVSVEGA